MNKTSPQKMFTGLFLFGLVSGFTLTNAHAESLSLSYEVVERDEGYVSFQLKAENISKNTVYDVAIEAANNAVPLLSFGDIDAGETTPQPVTLTWKATEEPPALNWTVTFTDNNGQAQTEIK